MSPQAAIRKTEMKRTTDNLVHSRRDDDADSDGHGSDHDGERGILLLDDFLPEVIGREFIDQSEGTDKDEDAENRVQDSVGKVAGVELTHRLLPSRISVIA